MVRNDSMRVLRGALVAVAALSLAACAGQKETVRPSDVKLQGPQVGEEQQERQISKRAQLLFEDAIKAFEAQQKANTFDYPSLEKKFEAALAEDGNLAEAEYNLGVLAERQGRKQDAIRRYEGALRRKPTLRQAAENLAVIMQNDGNVQGAVTIYGQILQHYPDDASARARLAEIYRRNGDHERAMAYAREALIRDPKTITAYKVMMRSYLDRDQLSMSRLVALRALKLDETDPELHHTVGLILLKENEKEKAMLQFKRAVEVRPDFVPSHVSLAKLALEFEDYPGAEEHLRRVLQADGKNAEALVLLGVAYKGMGQFDKALVAYEDAEKVNPNLAAIYLNRGIILAEQKDAPERAVDLYKKYMQLQGGDVALRAENPVFALLREAETSIQVKAEAKRAEEEAARMEAELAKQEAEQKAMEEKAARDAQKANAAQEAIGDGAQPATGAGAGQTQPASATSGSGSVKKDEEKKTAATAPAPAVQPEAKKAAPAAPAAPKRQGGKSDDEPADNL